MAIIDNTFIQSEADDLLKGTLRKLFSDRNCLLGENETSQKFEKGIDYFFEIFNETNDHILLFLNQNKGTKGEVKLIKNKKNENFGKISFQLDDLRHADYFYHQLEQPLIFTLCDINEKKIFWYDIQNDSSLPTRITEQKINNKNSIQLYLSPENLLNEENFDRFLEQIKYSKYNQVRKKEIATKEIEADYSKSWEDTKGKHIIDKIIYTLGLFESVCVLPTYVIGQLAPFLGTKERTYVRDYNLYSDNEEFFDFMSSIVLQKNVPQVSNGIIYVDNQKEKLVEIVKFFQINYILHIRWGGKKPKDQICIHKLFEYKKCECERCSFERLNFIKTKELLLEKNEKSDYEILRKGYTYYLMGDYIQSSRIFLHIHNNANKIANPIAYTISTYNLIKLSRLIEYSYYGEERKNILNELESIKFHNDDQFVEKYAPYFIDVYKNIKEGKFYDNYQYSIENKFLEIQKVSFEDKYGSWFSSNKYSELESSYQRFNAYLKHNFIIFSQYSEYETLSKKVLECFFALFYLKNPLNKILEKIDWVVIELWIFNVNKDYSKYLIEKYDIKKIEIHEEFDFPSKLHELLDNLFKSKECLKEITGFFKPVKIDNILSNILSISHLLSIDLKEKKKVIFKILGLCNDKEFIHLLPSKELITFVSDVGESLDKIELKKVLDILLDDNEWKGGLGRIINLYVEKCSEEEIHKFIKEVLSIESINDIDFTDDKRYLDQLFYSFTLLGNDLKQILKASIKARLNDTFIPKLFNSAIILELIDFDVEMFTKFVDSVPDMSNVSNESFLYGNYDNIKLNQVINIAYKYNLPFNKYLLDLRSKSHNDWIDYYTWLMDIDGFDYSRFKHYWILEYGTVYYYERFKKSEILKLEIMKALNNDFVEGVAKVYLKHIA